MQFQLFNLCSPYNKQNGWGFNQEVQRKSTENNFEYKIWENLFHFLTAAHCNLIEFECISCNWIAFGHRPIVPWWLVSMWFHVIHFIVSIRKSYWIKIEQFAPIYLSQCLCRLICFIWINETIYTKRKKKSLNYRALHTYDIYLRDMNHVEA